MRTFQNVQAVQAVQVDSWSLNQVERLSCLSLLLLGKENEH